MRRMMDKKLPMVILCWVVIIGMVLTSSPAFSRERGSSSGSDRTHESDKDSSRGRDTYSSNGKNSYSSNGRDTNSSNGTNRYYTRNEDRSRSVRVIRPKNVLPTIIATGIIAGITFSLLDRNDAPALQTATPGTCPNASRGGAAGSVMVTAGLLNLRSGPGLNTPCVGQLHRGAMLSIMGTSAGWYYVMTSAGVSGWVMTQYTTTAASVSG